MNKVAFFEFLKEAKRQGASGQDVANVLKEASGEQIDPHQLEALLSQLPPDGGEGHPEQETHGHPEAGGAPQLSEEEINQIAQIVLQHLQEAESQGGAGAGMQGLPPEHQAGLDAAKTAEYIGEFIKRANEYGIGAEASVNMYCTFLDNSISKLQKISEYNLGVSKVAADVDESTLSYFQGVAEKAASENLSYEQTLEILQKSGAAESLKNKFTFNQ